MAKTKLTTQDFQKLNLLAQHASANAPHKGLFHNFAADFEDMFPTPVGHVDQRDDYRSALSPAAYLVDLVRLVSGHINPPGDSRLALPNRRPDIFELELSRKKAEHPVPYLEIANKVMRRYLKNEIGPVQDKIGPDTSAGFSFAAKTITRHDDGNWACDTYAVGDYVTITAAENNENNGGFGPITAVDDKVNGAITIDSHEFTEYATDKNVKFQNDSAGFGFAAKTVTRHDDGNWAADAYTVGDYVIIATAENNENNGRFGPITAVDDKVNGSITIDSHEFTEYAADKHAMISHIDALERLAAARYPFDLPFHRPLTEIRTYLQHFQIDLADIYAAFTLSTDDPAWVAETLKLAPGELTYLASLAETYDDLNTAYGVTIDDSSLGGLDTIETFLAQTDLTLEQLEMLVKVRVPGDALSLAPADLAAGGAPESLTNLTPSTHDYLNRFIRLANRLGWSFDDLDWALISIEATLVKSVEENQADLAQLAKIEYLRNKYKLPIDVLCGFHSDLRTTPPFAQADGDSLFDRVFNTPPFYHGNGMPAADNYEPQTTPPISWDSTGNTRSGDVDNQKVRASLQGALNIGAADLDAMINHLFAAENQRSSITLDLSTLTRLYRLSKLAQVVGMAVTEYLTLLKLITKEANADSSEWYLATPEVAAVDDVLKVAKWVDWLTATGLNAFQLQYLTGGSLSIAAARTVDQALTPATATTAVNNYLKKLTEWAVKPAAFAHSGVDTNLAASIRDSLVNGGLLDLDGLVYRSAATLTEDAVTQAIGVRRFFATGDAGLWFSDDNGTKWDPVSSLPATNITQVVAIDERLFAATGNAGLWISDENGTPGSWMQVTEIGINSVYQVVTSGDRLFAVTGSDGLWFSDQNGTPGSWMQLSGKVGNFIVQIVASGDRLFAATGGDGLWFSDENGTPGSWKPVGDIRATNQGTEISTVIVSGNRLFAATGNVGLWFSDENGTPGSWQQVSEIGPDTFVLQVVASGDRLFAATGGQGLWFSDQNGTPGSWQQVSEIGIDTFVHQVVASGTRLFTVTHNAGFWFSEENGTPGTWKEISEIGINTQVLQIVNGDSRLFVATNGEGLYFIDDNGTPEAWKEVSGISATKINQMVKSGNRLALHQSYIQSIVKILKDALEQQTKAAAAFWSGVVGADTAVVSAVLMHVLSGDDPAQQTSIAPALVQRCRIAVGTAQAGDEQSIILADDPGNRWLGSSILITTGTGAGQIRAIKHYHPGTKDAFVDTAWETTPDLTSQYVIVNLEVVDQISRLLYLAKAFALSAQQLQSILNHAKMFGDPELSTDDRFKDLAVLRQIADFKQLTQAFARQGDATKTAAYVAAAVNDPQANSAEGLLRYLSSASGDDTLTLSLLSGWDADQIVALTGHLAEMASMSNSTIPTAHPISDLATMQRCFGLATKMGTHIQLLIDLCKLHLLADQAESMAAEQSDDHDWPAYESTAKAFLSVVRSKYGPDDWSKTFEPIRDHLNELERDALAAFLLRQLQGQFDDIKTMQDLYEFLLVDVEMSGCAQTTYVREAIDCLQIYIQRCRMNLESGASLKETIPDDLWDWMGHYRLWQANRKIFFYPENYLDPTLRTKEATPEFKALQSELLQGDINKDTVERAYINYFDKLDQLANLEIVNGCYAKVPNPNSGHVEDTLFLIGRTATEPPIYYQRRAMLATNVNSALTGAISTWSPWQKIDVNIPVDQALPLYAADRLYIFWVEQKTITDRDDDNRRLPPKTTATIKFSHQQVSGRWVQPQVLAKDVDVTNLPQSFWFAPGGSKAQGNNYLWLSQLGDAATSPPQAVLSTNPQERFDAIVLPADNGTMWKLVSDVDGSSVKARQVVSINNRLFAYGNGPSLYITDNNGTTWAKDPVVKEEVRQIVHTGNRIFVSTGTVPDTHLYVSDDGGTTLNPITESWAQKLTDLCMYANRPVCTTELGMFTSYDAGTNWKLVSAEGQYVFVGNRIFYGHGKLPDTHLSVSDDGGTTWNPIAESWAQQLTDLRMCANRPVCTTELGIFTSYDNGTTWKPCSAEMAIDVQSLAIGKRIFVFTGTVPETHLYVSDDIGTSWKPINESWAHQLTGLDALDNRPFFYTNEGIFTNKDDGTRWTQVGKLRAKGVTVIGNQWFATGDESALYVSDDQGATWKLVSDLNVLDVFVIGNRLFAVTADNDGLYQQVLPVIPLMVADGDTWLAIPTQPAETASTYRFHRVTTRCVDLLRTTLVQHGLDTLLTLQSQMLAEIPFANLKPTVLVQPPYPADTMDFDLSSPYALYFREIFFHIPYLIGDTLQAHQHFEEAKRWYEYIFNPTQRADLPSDKLLAYWPLTEDSYDREKTTFASEEVKDGPLGTARGFDPASMWVNAVTPFAGRCQVLQFDGTKSVVVAALENFHADRPFTVEAWLRPQKPNADVGIIFSVGEILAYYRDKNWGFEITISGITSSIAVDKGCWHHLAISVDANNEIRVYLDGVKTASGRNEQRSAPHDSLFGIGCYSYSLNGGNQGDGYVGNIAEVRIWDNVLSGDQICLSVADRYWQYRPFRYHTLEDLTDAIKQSQQIRAYEDDPFDPFAIAEFRLGAYEKAVVMQYIDNLLAWGDSLYALDGWENLNAATTLYVLAAELLGPRPKSSKSFIQAAGQITVKAQDAGRDVHQPNSDLADVLKIAEGDFANPFFDVSKSFFLPENDQFAGYWDKVEQRLYQIRDCMNLQGLVRQLPLFDPAIDPRQLLRAVAAGRAISAVTAGLAVAVPHYRFAYLLERARQVTSELKQLGGALLSALEKQDGEQLAVLRNTYEGAILNLTTLIKQKQQEETKHSLEGLQQSLAAATMRRDRHQQWATEYLSPAEIAGFALTQGATALKTEASLITTLSGIAYAFPTIYGLADGGMNFGKAVEVAAGALSFEASILEWAGQLAMTKAQYDRRQLDWQLQADLANYDVLQINAQINALTVRQAMVDQELAIHQQTITQNQGIADYYRQKFTSQELYQWMVSQLGALYFQTYQLALDLARMAERAFQYERNTDDSYVNVNGWDGLTKGLLAGEALALNLNQLEKAYIEQNARQLEIEKTISLLQLNPQALLDLKRSGRCTFALSEALFDLDFPGHYLRKIKTISLSIPAVVGPYQNVRATLIQQSNQVALTPDRDTVKLLLGETNGQTPDSSKLRVNWQASQQIALSRGVNDTGLFELNFNDERYLPFEGTGAISTWELRMPKASNPIDFGSISDVIITLRYTACDGGDAFRRQLLDTQSGAKGLQNMRGYRLFSVRQLNAAGWQALKTGTPSTPNGLELVIDPAFFPLNLGEPTADSQDGKVKSIAFYAWPPQNGNSPQFSLTLPGITAPLPGNPAMVGAGCEFTPAASGTLVGTWTIQLTNGADAKTALQAIDDLLLIVPFQGALNWDGWLSGA